MTQAQQFKWWRSVSYHTDSACTSEVLQHHRLPELGAELIACSDKKKMGPVRAGCGMSDLAQRVKKVPVEVIANTAKLLESILLTKQRV